MNTKRAMRYADMPGLNPDGFRPYAPGRMRLYDGGGSQESSTRVEYSPAEQKARDFVADEGIKAYKGRPRTYLGAAPAGTDSATAQGQRTSLAAADSMTDDLAKAEKANDFGLRDVMYAESNPYLQSAMDAATRPMVQQFEDAGGTAQQIRQGALSAGGYGGSRQGIAEGLARGRLNQTVADTRASMANEGYKTGLDQYNNSIKNQGMLSMMNLQPGQIQSGVGAQREAAAQQKENYAAKQRETVAGGWEDLGNLANIVYGGSNGTTITSTPQPDNTAAYVGAAGTALMAAMMF